jgi:hypothetical protein
MVKKPKIQANQPDFQLKIIVALPAQTSMSRLQVNYYLTPKNPILL